MTKKPLQAGKQNPDSNDRSVAQLIKKCVSFFMLALLLASPSVSDANMIYLWKDTCCIVKKNNNDRYSRLIKITTPDQSDFKKADWEIRKNIYRDILNEGKISVPFLNESDPEINRNFNQEYQIQLNTSNKSDEDIHTAFRIAHLNWKFEEEKSDRLMHKLFFDQVRISFSPKGSLISDEIMHWNYLTQNLQFVSQQQLVAAERDINHALNQESFQLDQ